MKRVMIEAPEPAVRLSAPLQVDARAAHNWDELHPPDGRARLPLLRSARNDVTDPANRRLVVDRRAHARHQRIADRAQAERVARIDRAAAGVDDVRTSACSTTPFVMLKA